MARIKPNAWTVPSLLLVLSLAVFQGHGWCEGKVIPANSEDGHCTAWHEYKAGHLDASMQAIDGCLEIDNHDPIARMILALLLKKSDPLSALMLMNATITDLKRDQIPLKICGEPITDLLDEVKNFSVAKSPTTTPAPAEKEVPAQAYVTPNIHVSEPVAEAHLNPELVSKITESNAVVTGDSVRVRATPSMDGEPINSFNKGVKVKIVSRDPTTAPWVRIESLDGSIEGWMHCDYLRAE